MLKKKKERKKEMHISDTFQAGCSSNTRAHVSRSKKKIKKRWETGYRGNTVSSSVKNSVGERHRIEEMERSEEKRG